MKWADNTVAFECAGEHLLGVLSMPEAPNDLGVVIVVGGPQYRIGGHRQFVLLARHLAQAGFPVLRFDTRGMGDSSGDFPGFENIGPDIRCAVNTLFNEVPSIRRVVLWGLCDAASAAMINASFIGEVAGLVLLNPWVRDAETLASAEVKHYYYKRLFDLAFWRKMASGQVKVFSSLGEFLGKLMRLFIRRSNQEANATQGGDFRQRMVDGINGFSGPVLMILSGRDLVAAEFTEFAARHPDLKNLWGRPSTFRIELPNADHTFSNRKHRGDVESATLDWLEQLLLREGI
jgi:uncharacterized protein